MDNQAYTLDTLIDDKNDFYGAGIFADVDDGSASYFKLNDRIGGMDGFNFVKQDIKDIIQIGTSNLAVFLLDKNHDLWIVGYFKYFPYIRKRLIVSDVEMNSIDYKNGFTCYPIKIDLEFKVVDVTTFSIWVFLLDIDGNIWKSGSNIGSNDFYDDSPYGEVLDIGFDDLIQINLDPIFTSIFCGKFHLVATDYDGNLWSYKEIEEHELDFGQSGFLETHRLKQVTKDISFDFITCGKYSTGAIDRNGNLYVCGLCSHYDRIPQIILHVDEKYCQSRDIGINYAYYLPNLVKIESDIRFKYLSLGFIMSLFVDIDGKLWGNGDTELLGISKISGSSYVFFTSLNVIDEGTKIKSVLCQNDKSYVLSDDGILFRSSQRHHPKNEFSQDVPIYKVNDDNYLKQLTELKILMLPNEKHKRKGTNTKSARNKI